MIAVAVVNQSTLLSQQQVNQALAALNLQLERDFLPAWGIWAQAYEMNSSHLGQPVIHLIDNANVAGALGYHDTNLAGPEGFVFVGVANQYGVPWQTVLSHEFLELLADPWADSLADTVYQGAETLMVQEICDPVEGDSYLVDGVPMSNFVLPTWFLPAAIAGTPHLDFLKRLTQPLTVTPGGYFSYAQQVGNWQQVFGEKAQASQHDKDYGIFSRSARRLRATKK